MRPRDHDRDVPTTQNYRKLWNNCVTRARVAKAALKDVCCLAGGQNRSVGSAWSASSKLPQINWIPRTFVRGARAYVPTHTCTPAQKSLLIGCRCGWAYPSTTVWFDSKRVAPMGRLLANVRYVCLINVQFYMLFSFSFLRIFFFFSVFFFCGLAMITIGVYLRVGFSFSVVADIFCCASLERLEEGSTLNSNTFVLNL